MRWYVAPTPDAVNAAARDARRPTFPSGARTLVPEDVGGVVLMAPSAWVVEQVTVEAGAEVLDVACGQGRHARFLAAAGATVTAVDRDPLAAAALAGTPGITFVLADLERDAWPFAGRRFALVVITNYLHRPLFPDLLGAVAPGGRLVYETFAVGNERFGRPSNPDFLLRPGELLTVIAGRLEVVAYEERDVDLPRPAMIQRICAVKPP